LSCGGERGACRDDVECRLQGFPALATVGSTVQYSSRLRNLGRKYYSSDKAPVEHSARTSQARNAPFKFLSLLWMTHIMSHLFFHTLMQWRHFIAIYPVRCCAAWLRQTEMTTALWHRLPSYHGVKKCQARNIQLFFPEVDNQRSNSAKRTHA
jgi:hypothetical protein